MKMTLKEMKSVCTHDVLKYIGPSLGGLLRNKLYTVKAINNLHIDFFMPKGQTIVIDMNDHSLWEMHEAKGAAIAKEKYLQSLIATFNSHMSYVDSAIQDLNATAEDLDDLLKDFPLDGKMKLLGALDKDQMEVLEFMHKIKRNRLTTSRLVKTFNKRDKNGT